MVGQETRRLVRFLLVTLVCFTGISYYAGPVAAQTQLGVSRKGPAYFVVSYEGQLRPGGSITFINTLTNNGPGTWGSDRVSAITISTPFGNYSVLGMYPAYFTENGTVLRLTVPIPANFPTGNYQVLAIASMQVLNINVFYGNTWTNEVSLIVQGTVPIQTPTSALVSAITTRIAKYWPPLLLIYVTTGVLAVLLVAESDRKKQNRLIISFNPTSVGNLPVQRRE